MTPTTVNSTELSEWSSPSELGAWLGVPVRTVYDWHHRGVGPRHHRVGRHVRYRSRDVEQWLADRAVATAGDPAA